VTAPIVIPTPRRHTTNQSIMAGIRRCATAVHLAQDDLPAPVISVLETVEADLYKVADEIWLAGQELAGPALRLLSIILQGCIDRVQVCLFSHLDAYPEARRDLARAVSELSRLYNDLPQ
jgi:hypothetical protein